MALLLLLMLMETCLLMRRLVELLLIHIGDRQLQQMNLKVETAVYRFGSVGQHTQLLLWDLAMDELVAPLHRPPGGSPTYSRTQSSHWDQCGPRGFAPLVAHRVHFEV